MIDSLNRQYEHLTNKTRYSIKKAKANFINSKINECEEDIKPAPLRLFSLKSQKKKVILSESQKIILLKISFNYYFNCNCVEIVY